MAITIEKQAQELQPVYNEMIFVVSSDNASESNFKFNSDIIVDGVTIASIKYPVNPQGYGVLDVHKHLQSQITHDFDLAHDIKYALNSRAIYDVTFSEEFRPIWTFTDNIGSPQIGFISTTDPTSFFDVGDEIVIEQDAGYTNPSYNGIATIVSMAYNAVVSAWQVIINKATKLSTPAEGGTLYLSNYRTKVYPVEHTLTDKVAFNGVNDFIDFIDWDSDLYTKTDVSAPPVGKFMSTLPVIASGITNAPEQIDYKLRRNSKLLLQGYEMAYNYIEVVVDSVHYVLQYTYNANGKLLYFPLGVDDINSQDAYVWVGGVLDPVTQPIIPVGTKSYQVFGYNSIPTSVEQGLTKKGYVINIDEDTCSVYEDIQLVFLDKLGSFVPFHFDLVNRNTKSVNRTNYQSDYGQYAPASNSWTYNTYDRGVKNLDTQVTDIYTINSNWVNQNVSNWLMELVTSPEVYWIKVDGTTVAINLTTNNIERKQVINDQIINYTFSFELSNKNRQQNG